jgi:tetratricopeptide (TPR) repeat protein
MTFQAQEPVDERGRSPAHQRYEQARRLMEAGAFEQAADLFDSSAVQSPHFKTYELLGECYMRLRRFTEAIPYLAAATTLNHGARAPSLLAEAWLAIDRRDKVAQAADLALSRDPKNKIAFRVREIAATKVDKKGHDDVV